MVKPIEGGARLESKVRPPAMEPGKLEIQAEPRKHRDRMYVLEARVPED